MSLEEELKSNASKIEQQISNLEKLSSQHRYGEFWTYSKQIVWMFKTYKPLLREDRERLWGRYGGICEAVKKGAESKKGIKAKQESHKKGREDATTGNIDLRRYATDNEYKTAFEIEERRILCPNSCDLNDLSWYHKMGDDRNAERALDRTQRRSDDELERLKSIRKAREKEIKKLFKKGLVERLKNFLGN